MGVSKLNSLDAACCLLTHTNRPIHVVARDPGRVAKLRHP
jgi:hypothetical protein